MTGTVSNYGRRREIAILGGGMAGLTAAWELTNHPRWDSRFGVTVYQRGWRLGGKCATGRGPEGRIEEHGIHVLPGWYQNAFSMIRSVFSERSVRRLAEGDRLPTWTAAFLPHHTTVLQERCESHDRWTSRSMQLPDRGGMPGHQAPPSPWEALIRMVGLGAEGVAGLLYTDGQGAAARVHRRAFRATRVEHWLKRATDARHGRDKARAISGLARACRQLYRLLAALPASRRCPCTSLGTWAPQLDLTAALLKGIVDGIYDPEADVFDFTSHNGQGFCDWLIQHGADPATTRSAWVRILDVSRSHRQIPAGTGARLMLLGCGYPGAWEYRFQAGTGDSLVMPLYQVLKARGVRFEFFHDVLYLDTNGTGSIERIDFARQAALRNSHYEPGIPWAGMQVWPAEPLYDQLTDDSAAAIRPEYKHLESGRHTFAHGGRYSLHRGKGFDHVVVAIPGKALSSICAPLIAASPRWRRMVRQQDTCPTFAGQLWFDKPLDELGLGPARFGLPSSTHPSAVSFEGPWYGWGDFSHTLAFEGDASGHNTTAKGVLYLSGRYPEGAQIPASAADGEAWARDWLDKAGTHLLPGASVNGAFDESTLHAPEGTTNRLKAQYIRLNDDPSEQYVLSPPGAVAARLPPDDTDFDNLWLAGDWTDHGLNFGCVESAVTSGRLAGHALIRHAGLQPTTRIHVEPNVRAGLGRGPTGLRISPDDREQIPWPFRRTVPTLDLPVPEGVVDPLRRPRDTDVPARARGKRPQHGAKPPPTRKSPRRKR